VLLFDEVEKAHPDVFNLMLQMLDDGRLTDGQGRLVDFKNTIIILTSNLGSPLLLDNDDIEVVRPQIEVLLREHFRPEFLNRIDETILFHRLDKAELTKIISLQINKLQDRLRSVKIELNLTNAALNFVMERGYDAAFGARPLKRAVQQLLENPLATALLQGDFKEGDVITVEQENNKLLFKGPTGF
jgi:ATP-dependent Clp protease ATP-binding subunit ClpB